MLVIGRLACCEEERGDHLVQVLEDWVGESDCLSSWLHCCLISIHILAQGRVEQNLAGDQHLLDCVKERYCEVGLLAGT